MKLILTILLIPTLLKAQEITLSLGGVTALTDVGGNKGIGKTFVKDLQFSEVNPAFGFSIGYRSSQFVISANYVHSTLSAADSSIRSHNGAENWRLVRRFYFKTPINELSITGKKFIGPLFISIGGGAMHFSKGPDVERSYSAIQPFVFYGAGIRWPVSESISFQLEGSGRKLFTDYIDNISLRGDPKDKDSYVSALFSLVFTGLFRNDYLKCPIVN